MASALITSIGPLMPRLRPGASFLVAATMLLALPSGCAWMNLQGLGGIAGSGGRINGMQSTDSRSSLGGKFLSNIHYASRNRDICQSSFQRKYRQRQFAPSETRMSLTVLGALSNPVVLTAAAIGTLDGFGRLILNLPRFLNFQYSYANKLLSTGSLAPAMDPFSRFRDVMGEKNEYRYNILRLFVKYDADGDGRLSKEELSNCLQAEFPRGLIQMNDQNTSAVALMHEMDQDGDNFIDHKEFLAALTSKALLWPLGDPDELLRKAKEDRLALAYEQCKQLTSDYAKTFYLATLAMPAIQARATWAIYAWCRRVDEIVDGPSANPDGEAQARELDGWMRKLDQMWEGKNLEGLDDFDLAFMDMLTKFSGSDIEPYRDMVRGMRMDIPDNVKYETWDDLYLYCYRVASTVGLMTLPVMGTAPGVTLEEARAPAIALGIALQITNILRDVGEDARERGRIYLPLEDLRRFGVTEESILERSKNGGPVDDNYRRLMQFQIDRAMDYYAQAERGIPMLSSGAQLPVGVALELYRGILDQLVLNGYDNFSRRAYVSKERKLLALPGLWWRTVTGGWATDPARTVA